jgi:hypothetical protein
MAISVFATNALDEGTNSSGSIDSFGSLPDGAAVWVAIIRADAHSTGAVTSVTDDASPSNTYTFQMYIDNGGLEPEIELWVADNISGSPTTISWSAMSSVGTSIAVIVFQGQDTPSVRSLGTGGALPSTGGYDSLSDYATTSDVNDYLVLLAGCDAQTNSVSWDGVTVAPLAATPGSGMDSAIAFGAAVAGAVGSENAEMVGNSAATGPTWVYFAAVVAVSPSPPIGVSESLAETGVLGARVPVSGTESLAEVGKASGQRRVSGAESLAETPALKVVVGLTGAEHVAETPALSLSQAPTGAESVAETHALRLSQAPTGAEHLSEVLSSLVIAKVSGTEELAETPALEVSAAPTGHELLEETGLVTLPAAVASGTEHLAEAPALVTSATPTGTEALTEAGAVTTHAFPTGAERLAETHKLVVSAKPKRLQQLTEASQLRTQTPVAGAEALTELGVVAVAVPVAGAESLGEVGSVVVGPGPSISAPVFSQSKRARFG